MGATIVPTLSASVATPIKAKGYWVHGWASVNEANGPVVRLAITAVTSDCSTGVALGASEAQQELLSADLVNDTKTIEQNWCVLSTETPTGIVPRIGDIAWQVNGETVDVMALYQEISFVQSEGAAIAIRGIAVSFCAAEGESCTGSIALHRIAGGTPATIKLWKDGNIVRLIKIQR
ncbi:MAG: hypothetical protein Q7S87_08915 [Agitococcus sp.]|nr:hypothetical protein [Agitococcus sp.]MDO9177021.1 hypothetical protein [Agitococcus sp.]